jgi:hypothetical protein
MLEFAKEIVDYLEELDSKRNAYCGKYGIPIGDLGQSSTKGYY